MKQRIFNTKLIFIGKSWKRILLQIIILKTPPIKNLADETAIKNDSPEILYEGIRMLEKENQCLKNKINNQQAVI